MGAVRNVAVAVLLISFLTFVAFFGRLPALRNTPVGFLHRVLWIHIPRGFRAVDQRLTQGRFSSMVARIAHTLWNDRHPVVMIFFILILLISEGVILIALPYITLYAAAASDPGYITPTNHANHMSLYPYDFTLYHPGQSCRTCHLLKPARSKHCSICKNCIGRFDHHCIFINNCVGYNNQHWFLFLLFTTAFLTTYATELGTSLLSNELLKILPTWTVTGLGMTWNEYLTCWAWVLQLKTSMGSVTLLCLLTSPLVWTLLGYHIYLIWAGTTTNESMKWSDWKSDMVDGYVFKRSLPSDRPKDYQVEPSWTTWPIESQQVVLRTEDGLPPKGEAAIGIGEWQRVWKLADVENLYDLGFWDNLTDVFTRRYGSPESDIGRIPMQNGVEEDQNIDESARHKF
ncbi:hypothetical protein B7494_g6204 [Chlorociboria aeruginascens]|nr:hypothetical protein B7494_g6204 [Chlorociboria aeruginascens]